jgi:hypothetical protein
MSPAPLPDTDQMRAHPELCILAALSVSLSLAREALGVDYPDDPDPLCPRLYAADVLLHHIDGLQGALALYREVLDGHDPFRFR